MKRIRWIDFIRGLTLISMIGYHTMWDLIFLFGETSGAARHAGWYSGMPGFLWQQSICWSFILISGFCLPMSKRPVRRGLIVFAGGVLVTVVTLIAMPEARVIFGVLTFLGTAMIVYGLINGFYVQRKNCSGFAKHSVEPETSRISSKGFHTASVSTTRQIVTIFSSARKPIIITIINIILFLTLRDVNRHQFGFGGIVLGRVPDAWYRNLFTTFLGFPYAGFYSTDYFSLVPWIFLYGVGVGLGMIYKYGDKGSPSPFDRLRDHREYNEAENTEMHRFGAGVLKAVRFLGRHTLPVYLVHQAVIYGVLWLLYH